MKDIIAKEVVITKEDIIEAMKEVIAPVVRDMEEMKVEQKRMAEKQDRMAERQDSMAVVLTSVVEEQKRMAEKQDRMAEELKEVKHDVAKKPDRDEFKMLLKDELKNNPAVYILDREGFQGLITSWLDTNLESKIKDVLRKEKVIK
ncbi:MAG: hypothetical protein H7844_09735 [Nitrospirae bacterium YQR-1]